MIKEIKFRPKTLGLIQKIKKILSEYDMPLTVRQIYYRLVAAQIIKNNKKSYKNLDVALTKARKTELISYGDITDRTRKPIKDSSWVDLGNFLNSVKQAYKRKRWITQDIYLEVWLEKEALANIFEQITNSYDLYLVVGRGYQSLSALDDAANRFKSEDRSCHILYFGDFDPTGEDIPRSIQDNLSDCFDLDIEVEKVAISHSDIKKYQLPPDLTKKTDSRSKKFISLYGDVTVELDALPPDILRQKIITNIERFLDKAHFEKELEIEKKEDLSLQKFIESYIE